MIPVKAILAHPCKVCPFYGTHQAMLPTLLLQGVPLLTALAVDIIQDRIAQQDVAAKFSKDEPLELFSVDCDEVFGA